MSVSIEENGNIKLKPNSIIFYEGEKVQNISIVTNGEIDVYISSKDILGIEDENEIMRYSCRLFSIPKNIMIGIGSYKTNSKYMFSFKSKDDTEIYAVKTPNQEYVKTFFKVNKAYLTNMYHSIAYVILKSYEEYIKIKKINDDVKIISANLAVIYFNLQQTKSKNIKSEMLKNYKEIYEDSINSGFNFPTSFDVDFIRADHSEIYMHNKNQFNEEENTEKLEFEIDYVRRFLTMPKNIKTQFFSYDTNMSLDASHMLYETLKKISSLLKTEIVEAIENILFLSSNENESLFGEYVKTATELDKQGKDNDVWVRYIRFMSSIIKDIYNKIKTEYDYDLNIDTEEMDSILKRISKNNVPSSEEANADIDGIDNIKVTIGFEELPSEVKDPTKKLIEMSGIDENKAKSFMKSLQAYRKLRDKFSTEDDVRKIRRGVTTVFFEIYKEIAKRSIINGESSRLVKMFLNFGYMDDQLLTPNQIMDLYEIKDKSKTKKINVFYIDEWLQKIYDKEEPPSVNGFGQDYREALRELKKRGTINDKELEEHWESSSKRLEYEVENMIETTHRLCYGQVSVYFPILHKDMITKDFERALIRRDVMEKSIKDITDIDFSAFYREVLYKNKELNIEKELVMQEVLPNIILMPTFGSRAIMWEELSSRQKNSTGRFLFPIFTSEDLESLLIPTIGAFRWELCKTMLGPAWNDITQMSITSEYSDYVQFYKKNRNLSDEAKEKLKIQIKKCRNNLREVFVSDYNLWIKYESKGIMRLNRVARGILYRQVPFAKNIRDELAKQPMFSEIANRFKNIRSKKATELENRYFKFTKTGNPLPYELQHHIEFYKDM
ncbi:cyclic nucleotide-binding protein [Brachyspira innocens]|uniref:Crp/Fnr family transcriptional regulator n=1 Tax=Brachyspira innocens TaxID=13264 RepID=A0ABT8Z032_9SPIR|nr:cyclic nucleotide-binding protein [Brachyspira innocens]MDO7021196.1 Crp/Fnr family transcriptional regulator [Brachyspira innocens]